MLKSLYLSAVLLLSFSMVTAQTGKWELRVEADPNLCSKQVKNNVVFNTKYDVLSFRCNEGIAVKCNVSEHFRIGTGLTYAAKGDNANPPIILRGANNIYITTVPGKIHETFDYLQAPLILDYFLSHKAVFNPYVSLGYINEYLIRGAAETIYTYPGLPGEYIHRQVYSASELKRNNARPYNASLLIGIGLEHYFAGRFNFSFQPNFQYSLFPFHQNASGGSIHFYSIGINMGLGYRF